MLFESTTILLRSIVHSLEDSVEHGWDDHLQSGNQCLYELHQLARPTPDTRIADSKSSFPTVIPTFERAVRTIPNVNLMMGAIRRKDLHAALESGRAAIDTMNGSKAALPLDERTAETQPVTKWWSERTSASSTKRYSGRDGRRLARGLLTFYGNTTDLLSSMILQLRTEAPEDDQEWQAQSEILRACLGEMVEQSAHALSIHSESRYVHRPIADKLDRALPHVRSMLTAMRDHDRITAVVHGEIAIRSL